MTIFALPSLAHADELGAPQRNTIDVQGQKIEVLSHAWASRKKLGSALLLPSLGQAADAPGLMAYLREQLPLHGLATFSVAAPDRPASPNFTTKAEDVSRAGDGTVAEQGTTPTQSRTKDQWQELRTQQRQLIVDTVKQVVPLMQSYPGGWVLITENQTASLVMDMIAQQQLSAPNLLVVVNPYSADPQHNSELVQQYSRFGMALLDLQSPDGAPASQATQAQRQLKIAALSAKQARQQLLPLNLNQSTAYAECLNIIKGMTNTALH
ncbi:DUF3530 family protein [Shewanella avicenniae]|uniref:DUF3530 family protein n=1 Tax=Shewanella avicenniae TaxID=2814294 RepID=A0ABX7QTX5_9GAMM|nr:DUF3530 family protein [Shewanella avicenniae]QSX34116.1 DUF3530 family protein [Shewanella avicenniae]